MTKINANKITLSKGSTGVTMASGTAATLSKIVSYQIPPGMSLILDEDTTVAIKDRGTTETADASLVEIRSVPSNGMGHKVIAQTVYGRLKFSQDKGYAFNPVTKALIFSPFSKLEIWVNSDQTLYGAVAASADFFLEAKYQ